MQSEYKIELAPNAQRQLKKLSKQLQLPIIQKLEDLKKTHEILYLDNEITIELAKKLLDDDVKKVNIVLHKYCHVAAIKPLKTPHYLKNSTKVNMLRLPTSSLDGSMLKTKNSKVSWNVEK